jgi:hypothetical protein
MNKKLILSRLMVSSCWLGLIACQGKLDVVDDTVGNDNSNLTGADDEEDTASGDSDLPQSEDEADPPPPPAPSNFGESIDVNCPCAQSDTLRALTCGRSVPDVENDIVQTTADGSIVAFNLCAQYGVDCTVAYWKKGSGTVDLGKGIVIGLDGAGDTLAVQSATGTTLLDTSGASQSFEISPVIGHGSLSQDGETLIGFVMAGDAQSLARATRGGGVELIADLEERLVTSAVFTPSGSAFGAHMMNRLDPANDEGAGFRWATSGAPVPLGTLPGAATVAFVKAISTDGSVLAGHLAPSFGAFRWTETTGVVQVGPSWGEVFLSADGSILLGGDNEGGDERSVYRWQESTGAVTLTSGTNALAIGMAADGSVVAGRHEDGGATRSFVWDAANGTRDLQDALELAGASMLGWQLGEPRVLSADGKVLIGNATCDGTPAVYRVELPE